MNMKIIINESILNVLFENIEPSDRVIRSICDSEKFCKAQGKITFGQLKHLVESSKNKRLMFNIGEGGFKALIRILPWFLPQLVVAGVTGSLIRALHKVFKPALEETTNYKTWWGKCILKIFNLSEGELSIEDPLGKIFFISDGLMVMLNDRDKVKFARYISGLVGEMSDGDVVPDFFVENELRHWVNKKFLLNPPLPPKI